MSSPVERATLTGKYPRNTDAPRELAVRRWNLEELLPLAGVPALVLVAAASLRVALVLVAANLRGALVSEGR